MTTFNNRQINSIFERIVKDKNGILVRVRFTVVQIDGKFAPQVISITPFATEKPICLPCIKDSKIIVEDSTPFFVQKISPYFSLDFLMSQPTRAPSYR